MCVPLQRCVVESAPPADPTADARRADARRMRELQERIGEYNERMDNKTSDDREKFDQLYDERALLRAELRGITGRMVRPAAPHPPCAFVVILL